MVSVIIPSRNEPYLKQTIQDLLAKASGDIEIIAVLDGYWPIPSELVTDKRVIYLHFSIPKGMRNAINSAVRIAKSDTLLKCDAHCMFMKGYDDVAQSTITDAMVMVPRRFALDPQNWKVIENNPKYPIDYMYLSSDFHGVVWEERNKDEQRKSILIDDLMSAQGSCWIMKKSYYEQLELLDETQYGTFYNEFQEIGLKCWLSGGRVVVNKMFWYAHWHKPREVGRGYHLDPGTQEQAEAFTKRWMAQGWEKQTLPISWLIKKFHPVPTWNESMYLV